MQNPNPQLLQTLTQTHSFALLNKLIKSQHQILISQLAKIDKLNEMINRKKEMEVERHGKKMEGYDRAIGMLEEQIRAKERLIAQVAVLGGKGDGGSTGETRFEA